MQNNFTTERLLLAPLMKKHNSFILELVNSPGWLQFIGDRKIFTLNDADEYITKINNNPNTRYWVVHEKREGTPVGIITLIKRDYLEFQDIGFAFLPGYGKLGYAFEATTTVLKYLTDELFLTPLLATTVNENVASISLLKKCNFKYYKEIQEGSDCLGVYIYRADYVSV